MATLGQPHAVEPHPREGPGAQREGAPQDGASRSVSGGEAASDAAQAQRDESPPERADRNYGELVQELRVAQTGVQILFGFLLAVAFTGAFPVDHDGFVTVLVVSLLTAFCASMSFMCPVLIHRLQFRKGRKESIVWVGHAMALMGMALLVISMDLAIWLVLAHVWSPNQATLGAVLIPTIVVLFWYVLPNRILNAHAEGRIGRR